MSSLLLPEFAAAAPVAERDRIEFIDVIRGFALLGILLMNIPGFAMPERFMDAWRADTGNPNFWVYAVNTVLFEGKMRALFSAVFGAGIVLFTVGKERQGRSATGLFYRRMIWLTLFGVLHAHLLLWVGDILYFYGIAGMLAYLLRRVAPKWLALGVPLVALVGFGSGVFFYQGIRAKRLAWREAVTAQATGKPLTMAQDSALRIWRDVEKEFLPNPSEIAANTAKMRGSYPQVASVVRKKAADGEFRYLLLSIWDVLALMLLGVALYRWGFLSGQWSPRAYQRTALIGYGVGLTAVLYSFVSGVRDAPTIEAGLRLMEQTPIPWVNGLYDIQRVALMMAHVSVLALLHRSGYGPVLFARLRAVGQTAFSNYILHTLICTVVFFGYGLGQFGRWEYYELYFLVLAIWTVQLLVSPVWLRHFQFGPLEWLWRSLTYGTRQPLRRAASVAVTAAERR